ncbi:hypothetical protein CTAM01_06011 [Colletotrichum tamarilloi]|uniref:Uncharacterized protein n=1 Tax=Colletotrichum tamarilloi TaxID=1209934 RepID=A0ABQ9RCY2_9PEZI|nr:uncharacterized protein CTAM01_06011 [Colletotrichum tamarilloi]KAK1501286.1 hypothetical protein CTAM01_06011 [Colletotrichum tamarilloi]
MLGAGSGTKFPASMKSVAATALWRSLDSPLGLDAWRKWRSLGGHEERYRISSARSISPVALIQLLSCSTHHQVTLMQLETRLTAEFRPWCHFPYGHLLLFTILSPYDDVDITRDFDNQLGACGPREIRPLIARDHDRSPPRVSDSGPLLLSFSQVSFDLFCFFPRSFFTVRHLGRQLARHDRGGKVRGRLLLEVSRESATVLAATSIGMSFQIRGYGIGRAN